MAGRPEIYLTQRDRRILKSLGQTPFLSSREIERLFFSSQQRERRGVSSQRLLRLRVLRQNGYIASPPRLHSRHPYLYALTRRGAAIADEGEAQWIKQKSWPLNLKHYRLIARFYTALIVALREKEGFMLLRYQGEQSFKRSYDRLPDAVSGQLLPVMPDGAAHIARLRDGKRRIFFVEADVGTENLRRITRKVRGYEAWRKGRGKAAFRARFDAAPAFGVIFVTPTRRRLQGLQRAVQKGLRETGSRRAADYFFLTENELTEAHILRPLDASGAYRRLLEGSVES